MACDRIQKSGEQAECVREDGPRTQHDETSNQLCSCNVKVILNWTLAGFVFAVLAWVLCFNILGAHTDAGRYVVYPAFESTYFEGKSGARVFTFLGVFYIIAGAVSLSCLSQGVHLPTLKPWWVTSIRLPLTGDYWTVFEILMLLLFVGMQVAVFVTRAVNKYYNDWVPEWDAAKLWYEVTKTLGKTCAITVLFLFIPVSKSSFWLDLFNMKFERAVKFHRWLAWFLVSVVVVHAASATTSLALAGQFKNCMWPSEDCENPGRAWGTYESLETSRRITYGWICFLLAVTLVVTSLSWFRRHKFEWFYYTHFLFIPCMVLLHLHYHDMIYYASPGLAAYVLDKVLWFSSSRRPIRIVNLSTPVRGFVRLKIACDKRYVFEPGQWVQIKVPAVSLLQWHPMSIASSPGHSTMTLDIKVLGDWTRGLEGLATRFDPSRYVHTCVFMDKFHGSSHMQMQGYLNHSAVLMVAGGIGITPMMSALRMLVENSSSLSKVRRAVLVWVVRKQSVVDLYRQELTYYQSLGKTQSGCELDLIVHATLSEKEDVDDFVAVDVASSPQEAAKSSTSGRKQWPFQKNVMGYRHLLILTVGAGGGYLLGIFLANYFSLDKAWRYEYVSLLQLCLAILFDAILALTGMSGSFFRRNAVYSMKGEGETQHKDLLGSAPPRRTSSSELLSQDSLDSTKRVSEKFDSSSVDEEMAFRRAHQDLNVILGCRPDLEKIFLNMKEWCERNRSSSVGVSVCGPDKLIDATMRTARETSTRSLPFIVDEETFEW